MTTILGCALLVVCPYAGWLTRLTHPGEPLWAIDLPTLVIVIAAGLDIGLLGFFNFDAARWLFGRYATYAFMIVGMSAIWQLTRQRYL
jgi:uncharacterized membrane protein YuzA (DUF378 family)